MTRLRSNFSRRGNGFNGFSVSFSALLLLLLKPPERGGGGVFSGSAVRTALHDARVRVRVCVDGGSAWGALPFVSLLVSGKKSERKVREKAVKTDG